ncbi:MAG: 2-isopropylmalate synthase [Methanobacteriaceae archaeon]
MYIESIEESKKSMNLPKNVTIFDTTLRDGEQSPGVALTVDEKIRIASKLDQIGVDIIEFGFPAVSLGEIQAAKQINDLGLNARICGLGRTLNNDIDALIDANLDYIHTFIGTSPLHREHKLRMDKKTILSTAVDAVEYAKDHGLTVEFSAEDATRTEYDFLVEVYKAVEDAGADKINVPDTVGVLFPSAINRLITDLKTEINIPISVHCHDDFGLAVANSLASIEAGAEQVHVTVNGLGERGGNASLDELVMALMTRYGIDLNIETTQLVSLSQFVAHITGIKMPPNKAIVGDNAFAHESGIHVHGILKNAATYEPMAPELVGHSRKIVLGKHTGVNALKSKLDEYGIEMDETQFCSVYDQIKALGDRGKCITDADLKTIAVTVLGKAKKELIKLNGFSVMSGDVVSSTATVKLDINGTIKETSSTGVGPVDASINAIKSLVSNTTAIELEEYHLEAITGGTDALAEVFAIVSDDEGNKATGRATREDIIMASVEAVLDSINKILMIKESEIGNMAK